MPNKSHDRPLTLAAVRPVLTSKSKGPIFASANLASGSRLPGDEDFTTRCDKARNETLGARPKEFVEPRFQYRAQPAFEVGLQRPERPLGTTKACDACSDGSLSCGGWDNGSGGEREHADIGQNAQFPEHPHAFDVSGYDFLRLAMHKMEKYPLPRWWRWTIDGDDNPPTAGPLQPYNKWDDLSGEIGDVIH